MAQNSIFWPTTGAGDGSAQYTDAELTRVFRDMLLADPAAEGVVHGLAVSGTASPLTIAAGAACVYGFPYYNDSAATLSVPTPTGSTTGHRVVLRVDWAAQTVRVALRSSANGVSSIPALVQTAGTTWEITLATLTISTAGVITLTDARGWAHHNSRVSAAMIDAGAVLAALADGSLPTAKLADGAVTLAKLAVDAVDDTKAGNRVPQFRRRQGGSSTDWSSQGTTTQTPGAVRMQAGVLTVSVTGGDQSASGSITFPEAFSAPPVVLVSVIGSSPAPAQGTQLAKAQAASVAANGFTLWVTRADPANSGSGGNVTASWLAIGPE